MCLECGNKVGSRSQMSSSNTNHNICFWMIHAVRDCFKHTEFSRDCIVTAWIADMC